MDNDAKPIASPQLTWPNVISTIAVVLTMALGAWTLLQSQRTADREYFATQIELLATRDRDVRGQLEKEILEIRQRRIEFVTTREAVEIIKRIEEANTIVRQQIIALEQTRPTTGELRAQIDAIQHRLNVQAERIMGIDRELRATARGGVEAPPRR